MSHNYFFELLNFIKAQLKKIHQTPYNNNSDEITNQFVAGRIEALCQTERFINDKFTNNLPRRLRANLKTNAE